MSLQARIIEHLQKNPSSTQADLVRNFPGEDYSYLAKTKSNWKKGKVGKKKKKGKKSKKVKKQKQSNTPHLSHLSAQNTPPGGAIPGTPIPEEIQRIATYMRYFDQQGLSVKFNEVLSYLDKTQQLDSGSGSELAQQMSTQQLLAVIKPSESLQPANSPSMSSFADLISPTNRLTNNS